MNNTFYSLTVKNVQRETDLCVSISFEIPEELTSVFLYKHGQYVTLKVPFEGTLLHRSYSICSCSYVDTHITIAAKEIANGRASRYLNTNVKPGDTIEVMPPMGNFYVDVNEDNKKHYILFGAGSGITPLLSILKAILYKEKQSRVTLFYVNQNGDSIIFKDTIQEWASQYSDRFNIIHLLSQPRKTGGFLGIGKKSTEEIDYTEGKFTPQMVISMLKQHTDLHFQEASFFICGPSGMMSNVKQALSEIQIPAHHIHQEYFTEKESDDQKESATVGNASNEVFEGTAKASVIYDSNTYEMNVTASDTILDAALDQDIDPPFACMVGACTTCKAKLTEGSVYMEDSSALTPEEIEEGYILTCQSYPKTTKICINYDE